MHSKENHHHDAHPEGRQAEAEDRARHNGFRNPGIGKDILDSLNSYLDDTKRKSVSELISAMSRVSLFQMQMVCKSLHVIATHLN